MSDEQTDLEQLATHPGWLRFTRAVREEWDGQLSRHIAAAANEQDDVAALNKLRQVIAAKHAVERALRYPEDRLQHLTLTAVPFTPSLSRGGR